MSPKRAISLIQLPYDSGRFEQRMGRGPGVLIASGLVDCLRARDIEAELVSIRLTDDFQTEGSALVQLQCRAVAEIRAAMDRDSRPILLSGNCGPAALSATAALGATSTGVIWFDAHADFNTPDTSASGFLDGMSLAIVTGECWPQVAHRFDHFERVPPEQIIQVGVRDIDAEEEERLKRSAIKRIGPQELSRLAAALRDLAERVSHVYVHLDVDVVDISEGSANSYACAGGLSLEELDRALDLIGASLPIAVGSITSYDPEADSDGRIAGAIPRMVELLARSGHVHGAI